MAGFTLVEMLAAIALLSLALGAFGSLFLRLEKTSAVIARMESDENVEVVRRFLERSFEQCRALPRIDAAGESRLRFVGEATRVTCTEISDNLGGRGGVQETTVSLGAGGQLLLRRQPADAPSGGAVKTEVLLGNVASLAFAFAACPEGRPAAPAARWTMTDRLPHRITLALEFRPGDGRRWRELSVFIPAAVCLLGE